jgi:hypothetical protein|tara:strand:+ start:209 stop:616 length:408 start_codon:yes stop_codon:yes gene_type:complete
MERFLYDNIIKIAVILSLPLWTAFVLADDHNYTFHGHQIDIVDKPDIIFTGNIRNAYSTSNDTIVIEMRDRKKYTLTVSFCWDLPMANGFIFGRQGISKHFNRIEKGLRVYTMDAFGRIDTQSCIVTDVKALEDV